MSKLDDDNYSMISNITNASSKRNNSLNYNYNRPQTDNRFKMLSQKEEDDDDVMNGDSNGRALPIKTVISNYDKKFIDYIVNMHSTLKKNDIDIDSIKNLSDMLEHLKKEQEHDYLDAMVKPEHTKGCKIPSVIPVPSSSFQLHQSTMITPNSAGHAAIMFNPYYLGNAGALSTFYVNNANSLGGVSSDNNFFPVNISQTIPAVYNEYRVVSASIIVKYVGRLDIVQGVIGGAIVFDQNVGATDYTSNVANSALAKYGNFNLAMDSFYSQENLTLNGIRELYFPLDSTFEQYLGCNNSKNGFAFMLYIYGGVPSSACYKIDIYINYECLPDSTFLNYLPVSSCTSGTERKQEAIQAVQQRPITDEAESRNRLRVNGSFWDNIKSVFGEILPSVPRLAAAFIPEMKGMASIYQAYKNK
ncbi:MAG: hypothetical protein ACRYGG_11440 [Janthinobacterium lividum]